MPYAIRAANFSGVISDSQLGGNYHSQVLFWDPNNLFIGGFSGNGVGLNNVDAAKVGGLSSDRFWQLGGNANTTPGADYFGTADSQPLELRVFGARALRLEMNSVGIPNVIGGAAVNRVGNGAVGATIGGGGADSFGFRYTNLVTADYCTIGGGRRNTAGGGDSTISGGDQNSIQNSSQSFIGGGNQNTIQTGACESTISGGKNNTIQTNAYRATIGGGYLNTIQDSAQGATIGGGTANTVQGTTDATISGGGDNNIEADFSTISGGYYNSNQLGALASTIGGGAFNMIQNSAVYSTIAGGSFNTVQPIYSCIGGGATNHLQTGAEFSTIAGGTFNTIQSTARRSCIGGGSFNTTQPNAFDATLAGGSSNIVAGLGATVPGGLLNQALGDYSFAAGRRAKANDQGAFIWCDSLDQDGGSQGANTFTARASGGYFLFSSGGNTGVQLPAGSGSWNSLSDRASKTNFTAVNGREVLDRLAALPMQSWNYTAQSERIRHLGAVAQDFYAAFGLGEDDQHISMVDADGVALAAIQGLNEKVEIRSQQSESRSSKRRTRS